MQVFLAVSIESSSEDEGTILEAKEAFTAAISRGGLTKPSNYLYVAAVNATALYSHISKDTELWKSLLATENPRETFIESYLRLTENDEISSELLKVKCSEGHSHIKHLRRTAFTIFNISAKNYASQKNDELRVKESNSSCKCKTIERSSQNQKVAK